MSSYVVNEMVALKTIDRAINRWMRINPYLRRFYDHEDLVHEVYLWFKERNLFERYNPEITSFEYLIAAATKNRLIDMQRKRLLQFRSLDEKILINEREGDTATLMDLIDDIRSVDPEAFISLKELADRVPDKRISPSYSLTWKDLFHEVAQGKESGDITVYVTKTGKPLTQARISQLIKELRDMCIDLLRGVVNRKAVGC